MRSRTTTPPPPPGRAPFPVADRSRDGDLYETQHPRLAAIRHLRELLQDGRAGLDPDDTTVLEIHALAHETVWVRSVVELTGLFLSQRDAGFGGRRFRMIVEADVRQELGLDQPGAPVFEELIEPTAALVFEHAERLSQKSSPVLVALADLRDAHDRRQERSVH